MSQLAAVRHRLTQARDLTALLAAGYEAFETLMSVIEEHEDPAGSSFTPFLLAGTCAANGRDAILFASSLPPRQLPRLPASDAALPSDIDAAVAISALLTDLLTEAAMSCADVGDRTACADAASCARQVQQLLTAGGP
jgi:hypothetical protein